MPGDLVPNPAAPLPPKRAPVVPRARLSPGGAALPIPTLIAPLLDRCPNGIIQIVGPALSGKTTALQHLAAVLPQDRRIAIVDEPQYHHWTNTANDVVTILATQIEKKLPMLATFHLAEWGADDCVEYLA